MQWGFIKESAGGHFEAKDEKEQRQPSLVYLCSFTQLRDMKATVSTNTPEIMVIVVFASFPYAGDGGSLNPRSAG